MQPSKLHAQGGHVKGFAVVADEVRRLAEESKSSANQIVALISSIQRDTKEVEKAVGVTVQNVNGGVPFIQNVQNAFDGILGTNKEMTSRISASVEELAASEHDINTVAKT